MNTTFGTRLSALAICALAIPAQAIEPPAGDSATESASASPVTDVAFAATGNFVGTIVDDTGKPLTNVPVRILHQQKIVATAKTNAQGKYSVQGLRSGLHIVQTPGQSQACRFWTAETAPPSAKHSLVMAHRETILRGQSGGTLSLGTLLPVAAFAAVTAVTVSSSTGNDKSGAVVASPPASP